MNANIEDVWEFHSSAEALTILSPASRQVKIRSGDPKTIKGNEMVIEVRIFGFPTAWKAKITDATPPTGFEDEQLKGPFKIWHHQHIFESRPALANGMPQTAIIDKIEYQPPLGILGDIANWFVISADLDRMFAYRQAVTREYFDKASLP